MRRLLVAAAILGVLVASSAFAQTTTSTSTSSSTSSSTSTSLVQAHSAGVLATAQAATGPSGQIVCFSQSPGARVLLIDIVGSSSPSGTVQVEHSTAPGTAGTWVIVATPSFVAMTPAVITTGISFAILNPVGCYRTNFTALSSGTFAITYQAQE